MNKGLTLLRVLFTVKLAFISAICLIRELWEFCGNPCHVRTKIFVVFLAPQKQIVFGGPVPRSKGGCFCLLQNTSEVRMRSRILSSGGGLDHSKKTKIFKLNFSSEKKKLPNSACSRAARQKYGSSSWVRPEWVMPFTAYSAQPPVMTTDNRLRKYIYSHYVVIAAYN